MSAPRDPNRTANRVMACQLGYSLLNPGPSARRKRTRAVRAT
jgi:hypothetical protein